MSVHVLANFMTKSRSEVGARLVGFVMADVSANDGICWLDQKKIAERTRLSERGVRDGIRRLEELGEIQTRTAQRGNRRINVYRLWCAAPPEYDRLPFEVDRPFWIGEPRPADRDATTGSLGPDDRQIAAITPPIELEKNVRERDDRQNLPVVEERPRDPLWDELVVLFGDVADKTNAHAKRNRAVSDLRRLGADVSGIRRAVKRWPMSYPGATLTDVALATHYPQLSVSPAGSANSTPPPVSEVVDLPELSDEERAANLERVRELAKGVGS